MMRRSSKSISFLMEFIIVILFFAISSSVCVSLYANAQTISERSNHTKTALLIAQNYIAAPIDTRTEIHYDENGNIVEKGVFVLRCEDDKKQAKVKNVNVYYNDEKVVSLPYVSSGGYDEK